MAEREAGEEENKNGRRTQLHRKDSEKRVGGRGKVVRAQRREKEEREGGGLTSPQETHGKDTHAIFPRSTGAVTPPWNISRGPEAGTAIRAESCSYPLGPKIYIFLSERIYSSISFGLQQYSCLLLSATTAVRGKPAHIVSRFISPVRSVRFIDTCDPYPFTLMYRTPLIVVVVAISTAGVNLYWEVFTCPVTFY